MSHPQIIQGGMGAGVSDWRLARAVSQTGQLGVVSGTAVACILARRLQNGDADGQMRRALEQFPVPGIAEKILADYYIPGGKSANAPYKLTPLPCLNPGADYVALTVAANFVEVFLAKEGHTGLVGINFLEKIQFPTLPSIFGAMLAGVDYVLMGAGIPRAIPGVLDHFARGESSELKMDIEGGLPGEEFFSKFDPATFSAGKLRYSNVQIFSASSLPLRWRLRWRANPTARSTALSSKAKPLAATTRHRAARCN